MAGAKIVIGPIDAGKLMLVICLMAAVEAPLRLITWHEGFSPLVLLATSRFIEAALIIGVSLRGKNGLSVVGLRTGKVLSGFRRGLLWSAGFGGIVLLVYISLQVMGIDPLPLIQTHLPLNTGDLILFFLVGGIISPVAEELLFSGVCLWLFEALGRSAGGYDQFIGLCSGPPHDIYRAFLYPGHLSEPTRTLSSSRMEGEESTFFSGRDSPFKGSI